MHALGQVMLPDGILQQLEKLTLRFYRSVSITENATDHVNLGPRTQCTKGSINRFKLNSPACVSPLTLWGTK